MRVHTGTDKNISFKIFSFGRVVCSRQGESTSEDKVRVFYAIKYDCLLYFMWKFRLSEVILRL